MSAGRARKGGWPLGVLRDSLGAPRPGPARPGRGGRAGAGVGGGSDAEDGPGAGDPPAAGTSRRAGRSGRSRAPRGPVGPERARDPGACHEAALRLLERTRRTHSDLARRLKDKGYDGAVIEQVIGRLESVGLIDDVEYARAFLAGRWGRRAAGWRVLENDLRRRGVSAEDITTARTRFEVERGGVDELAGALRAIEQVARRYAKLEPRLRRRRLWGMLARKGFDGDTIEAAIRAAEVGPLERDEPA